MQLSFQTRSADTHTSYMPTSEFCGLFGFLMDTIHLKLCSVNALGGQCASLHASPPKFFDLLALLTTT